jgi:hypothetical protein
VRDLLALCWHHQRFVYEVRPDLFPQGWLTDREMALWWLYLDDLNERLKQR